MLIFCFNSKESVDIKKDHFDIITNDVSVPLTVETPEYTYKDVYRVKLQDGFLFLVFCREGLKFESNVYDLITTSPSRVTVLDSKDASKKMYMRNIFKNNRGD